MHPLLDNIDPLTIADEGRVDTRKGETSLFWDSGTLTLVDQSQENGESDGHEAD